MANKKTLSARVHIPLDDIADLLHSAERGISYWGRCDRMGYELDVQQMLRDSNSFLMVKDEEENAYHMLSLRGIKSGLTIMAKKDIGYLAQIVSGEADMYTADAFVQYCLFGEVKYS